MLLRATDPELAADEKALLGWYIENFGQEDTETFTRWVWLREQDGNRFARVLRHIHDLIKSEEARGVALGLELAKNKLGREVFERLLLQARKPKVQGEAETQLMETMRPHIERVRTDILGHRGSKEAVDAGVRELRVRLRENIHKMWPDKHRATVDGAIMVGAIQRGGTAVIDFARVVSALMENPDALASTAASSHGVTDDR